MGKLRTKRGNAFLLTVDKLVKQFLDTNLEIKLSRFITFTKFLFDKKILV